MSRVKGLPSSAQAGGGLELPHSSGHALGRLDNGIELPLVALIAFAPWPYGSVEAWSQDVIVLLCSLVGCCFAYRLIVARQTPIVRPWVYLPIGLFFLLALFQLVPLFTSILRLVSPNTVSVKSTLLSDLSGASSGPMTLTFYSQATWHDLRLLIAVSVVFITVLNVFRSSRRIKRLLAAISVVGGAVAGLALAQDATGADRIFWRVPAPIVRAIGGPFVSHNHFCQFMNLSIGAALALLLVWVSEKRAVARGHRPRGREPHWATICCLGAMILAGSLTVVLSLSRGGMISLLASIGLVGLVAAFVWRMRPGTWLILLCALAVFGASAYEGIDSVNQRLVTLGHASREYLPRAQIVKDICANAPRFPLFGMGLGTHEFVYPSFEHLKGTPNFDHAENEFAQMLEETGAIGTAIVLLFGGMVVMAFFAAIRSRRTTPRYAAFGLGVGLLAIGLQSCVDFGQHLPANALLTAIECALLFNLADLASAASVSRESELSDRGPADSFDGGRGRVIRWGLAGIIIITSVVALSSADRARRAAHVWLTPITHEITTFGAHPPLSDADIQGVIDAAYAAHQIEPKNITYLFQLATFRWEAVDSHHDPATPDDARPEEDKELARRVIEDFKQVRRLCPTYGPAAFMEGQLEYLVLDEPQGADLVRLAERLDPTNPSVVIQRASIECKLGNYLEAVAACRRYLQLEGVLHGDFADVAEVLVHEAGRPDLAIPLADNDPDRLMEIVHELRRLPDRTDFQTLAASLETQANSNRKTLLTKRCEQPNAPAADVAALADICRSEHDLDHAIIYYRRALVSNYDQIDWRLKLSQALLDAGRKDEAEQEAAIVLRLQPDSQAARKLISDATGPGGASSAQ